MRRRPAIVLGAAFVCVIAITSSPSWAGVDISFGASVPIGDDGRVFLSISSHYFDRDARVIEDYGRRYFPDPDDLSVALFLARHCDRDVDFLFSLRKRGLGWMEISNRCSVPVDVFFVPVARDPGPPYGKAYGHWKKHRKDRSVKVVLTDADVRNLVAVRMAREYYGVPVETAMKWRSGGGDVRAVMVGEYRKRHGDRQGRADDRDDRNGRGHRKSDEHRRGSKGKHGKH